MQRTATIQPTVPTPKASPKALALPPWAAALARAVLWLGACLRRGCATAAAVLASWCARCLGQAQPQSARHRAPQHIGAAPLASACPAPQSLWGPRAPARAVEHKLAVFLEAPRARCRRASLSALAAPLEAAPTAAAAPVQSDDQRLAQLRERLQLARDKAQAQQAQMSHTFVQLAASQVQLSRAEKRVAAMGRRIGSLEEQLAAATGACGEEAALRARAEAELKKLRHHAQSARRAAAAQAAEAAARLDDADLRVALAEARADRAQGTRPSPGGAPQLDLADQMARLSLRSPSKKSAAAGAPQSSFFEGQGAQASTASGLLFARPKAPGPRAGAGARRANKSAS